MFRHRRSAGWLLALALILRLIVPGGYMIGTSAGGVTIELCSGMGPMAMPVPATPGHTMAGSAMAGMGHHQDHPAGGHPDKPMPCAFAGLSAPGLAAIDPLLLVAAIAFLVATVFRIADRRLAAAPRPAHLRPPLRGPPLNA